MKCDDLNRLIILAIVFGLIGSVLALGAELLNQRCDKKEEIQQNQEKSALNKRLDDIERRISKLEKP